MSLTQHCAAAVTDSGGYQKETYYAGKRAVVVMPDTGWRELTDAGWNVLCAPENEDISKATITALNNQAFVKHLYGDGSAGKAIIDGLLK
jgi:UDP-N-acetylglucosamine 2-epimerase